MVPDGPSEAMLTDTGFQEALVNCLERLEQGESLDRERLDALYPQCAAALASFIKDQDVFRQVASQLRDSLGGHQPIAPIDETMDSNPKASDFTAGDRIGYIGEYEILDEIARGGMGIVFKARQEKLNRVVALKMILSGKLADATDVQRFHREAQAAGRLKHPSIVPVHDVGEHEGRHYFTMDFVDGRSLAEELREESLAARRAAALLRTVAEAVHFAHQQGTVHRDLKPANILLTADGAPHITDFGLAKVMDAVDEVSRAELTASGQILGTPSYMSPEQASGKQQLVGPASDIYSLGAILYASLTGRAPFVADSAVDTLLQVIRNEPVAPRTLNPSIPRDLETICLKCLTKEPHKRYGTAEELAADLQRFLDGRPVVARPVGPFTRYYRWCQRNPAIAALSVLLFASMALGASIATNFAFEAERRADSAMQQRRRADQQTELAQQAENEAKQALRKEELAHQAADAARQRTLAAMADTELARDRAEKALQAEADARLAAEDSLAKAEQARKEANEQRLEAQWQTYVARLTVMQRPWEDGEFGQLARLLEQVRPDEHQPDFRGWEWNYYFDQTEQAARNLGMSEDGRDVAWSPDGRRIATASSLLEVWDAETGRLAHQTKMQQPLSSVCWSSDNNRLAVGMRDGSVLVYDVDAGKTVEQWPAHSAQVWSIDWSPESDQIASGSSDGGAALWDAKTGELLHRLMPNQRENNKNYLRVVDWSPTSDLVATTHRDGYVRVFDAQTGELKFRKRACGISCNVCAWSPDGKLVAAGGSFPNYEIIFYTTTGERVGAIKTATRFGRWSPDGKFFAVGGEDHDVTIWNVETKEVDRILRYHFAPVKRLAWGPDSQRLASVSDDGTARVWKLTNASERARPLHNGPASARIVAYSPDGKWIAGGFADKAVRIWDAQSGELVHNFDGHTASVKDLSWSSDSRQIVSICSNNTVWLWSLANGASSGRIMPTLSGGGVHPWVAWQPGTNNIAMGELADRTRTYDALTGDRVGEGATWTVTGRWSHDGTRLGQPGVSVLNNELETIGKIGLRHDACYRLSWSPDDRLLACAGEDGRLRVVDLVTHQVLRIGQGHGHMIRCVAWHPSGARIASGGDDGKIIIWDAATLDALWSSKLQGNVLSLDWSPDGRHLVSSHGHDGQITTKEGEPLPEVRIWGSLQIVPPSEKAIMLNTSIAQALTTRGRDREIATAILQAGGRVAIVEAGVSRSIDEAQQLPTVGFQLTSAQLQGVSVDQTLLEQLSSGLVLGDLNLRGTGLTDGDVQKLIRSLSNVKHAVFDATRRQFRIESDGSVVVVMNAEEELKELSEAVERNPSDASLVRKRGEWYAGQLRWQEARQDLDRVMELRPDFSWEAVCAARAALMMNDVEGFQKRIAPQVEKLLERGSLMSPATAYFIASTAALPSLSEFDLSQLLPFAQAHSQAKNGALWATTGTIIVKLRLGHAEEVLQQIDKYRGEQSSNHRIFLEAARALAHHQLGDALAAEEALKAAQQLADKAWLEPAEGESIGYSDFGIYVEARLLLDEARRR